MKLDSEDIEFWFGDFYTESAWFVFYLFLENNPQPLLDILYDPNLNSRAKSVLLDSMEQLAWHYPERREEVIGWLESLLKFYLDNIDNVAVFDSVMVGYIEYTAMNLQAKSLLPLLKEFHELSVIDEMLRGNYEEVVKGMDKDPIGGKGEFPNIYTLTEKEAKFIRENVLNMDENEDDVPYFKTRPNELSGKGANNQTAQSENSVKKVGRNDPCPCGSGKKYKKCCGG